MKGEKYSVLPIKKDEIKDWFLSKHYAKRIPAIIIYSFGLYLNSSLVGVIAFGRSANNNLNEIIDGYNTYELQRLVIQGRHPASLFISKSIKLLPKPLVIISYADTTFGHHGYVYQASNFLYTGLGSGDVEYEKDGTLYHRKVIFNRIGSGSKLKAESMGYLPRRVKGKHRYIYLHASRLERKKMLKELKFEIYPYPKGDNIRYDDSYKVKTQELLF